MIRRSHLFDTKWYRSQHREVRKEKADPVLHYILEGAALKYDPSPQFSTLWYLDKYPDVAEAGLNPLLHYIEMGWKEGREPHPQFRVPSYFQANPDVASAGRVPLDQCLRGRVLEGRPLRPAPRISFGLEPTAGDDLTVPDVRLIAFYLPQFHRIPENDAWWGEGFTEWSNVRRGRPQFQGHYQPHVPHPDVGYYDLTDVAVMERQAELAHRFGIGGFCYYYYWFAGKRLLELPIERLLNTGRPDFPFCLCWANENWTRRWDGMESEVLIAQNHSPASDHRFITDILPALRDHRYIKIDGRPLLIIYRPLLLPEPVLTFARWREECRAQGLGEIYLAGVQGLGFVDPRPVGLDGAIEFPPHDSNVTAVKEGVVDLHPGFRGTIYDYRQAHSNMLEKPTGDYPLFRGAMVSWDNTARRGEMASVFINSSPEEYHAWLKTLVEDARSRPVRDERLVFVNAWNEWAEGCHLEPDERYGYAWLNATRSALLDGVGTAAAVRDHPVGPVDPGQPNLSLERVPVYQFPPLPERPVLKMCALFYHKEDLVVPFIRGILPQVVFLARSGRASCELSLVLNYPASASVRETIDAEIAGSGAIPGMKVTVVENGCNHGFGAAHNQVFASSHSDVFLVINSDVSVGDIGWLAEIVRRFSETDVAVIGLKGAASRLRSDGCGISVAEGDASFDYVDGSALAIRSEIGRRLGLFDPSFFAFYFEDVDLCLRLREAGLRIEVLDVPYEHNRSASAQQIPGYVIQRVLDHNRARFFERWKPFLVSRQLRRRLDVRFSEPDRTLQAAFLPALFGLLRSHPGAVADVQGIHSDLRGLFRHPRVNLVDEAHALPPSAYHQSWTIREAEMGAEPLPLALAAFLGCEPDFEAARAHLEGLAGTPARRADGSGKKCVALIVRTAPLFPGRIPPLQAQTTLLREIRRRGFTVWVHTDLADFELDGIRDFCVSRLGGGIPGLLRDILEADLVVAPDHWALQLTQGIGRPTLALAGATSATRRIWDADRVGFHADLSLVCIGCYHRWGGSETAFCIRGDQACVAGRQLDRLFAVLDDLLASRPAPAAAWLALTHQLTPWTRIAQGDVDLSSWSARQTESVLVLIPMSPKTEADLVNRARVLATRATRGMKRCRIVFDAEGKAPPRGNHAVRQEAMAAIRQGMVERHLRDEAWVFWVDVDIVDYPEDLIEKLAARADGGIAAPIVLMAGNPDEPPSNSDGFGPGRFFDIGGFVEGGRWARFDPPYFDQPGPVFDLDSVGSCYLVNAELYRQGARHTADPKSAQLVAEGNAWPPDAVSRNQSGPANAYTEHYSVCQFTREKGLPVRAFGDLIALHQRV